MSFVINPYAFERVNLVQNGDFSNISGMGVTGGGWYNNTPPSWLTQSTARDSGFSVLLSGGQYRANLNTLSQTVSPTLPNFYPLYQEIASLPFERTYTAAWTISSLNNNSYFLGAALFASSLGTAPLVIYSSPFDNATRTVSMTTNPVPANTVIIIAFWQASYTAPGITNVQLYAD